MEIIDISDVDQLIRFAANAQIARVNDLYDITQNMVANASGIGGPNLTRILNGKDPLTDKRLRQLDAGIVALTLASNLDHIGGLGLLGVRLRKLQGWRSLSFQPPADWDWELLQRASDDEFGVLTQAAALVSAFTAVEKANRAQGIRDAFKEQISDIIDRLILIGVAPPTSRNVDALVLVGSIAKYSFDITGPQLEKALRDPLGFRLWRAITKLVIIGQGTPAFVPRLIELTQRLLGPEAAELREMSLYPGRSLDLELAINIPAGWSMPTRKDGEWAGDYAGDFLLARARMSDATIRERGTAALGLWQRALTPGTDPDYRDHVEQQLRQLITEFDDPGTRPDAAAGLRWVATTLQHVIDGKIAVCNEPWPKVDEPWYRVVCKVADSLGATQIPDPVRQGIQTLFKHALLQCSGVERRQAIETLVASGWTEPVARALGDVLKAEKTEAWLRIRVLFALGFLQQRDVLVAGTLTQACHDAYQNLKQPDPSPAQINEMHSALFAIGDCFGAGFGARHPSQVAGVRAEIQPILTDIVTKEDLQTPEMFLVARAAGYLLTVTAQDRRYPQTPDLAEELLGQLCNHPDPATRRLANWARFRFDPDSGKILPLLHAAIN